MKKENGKWKNLAERNENSSVWWFRGELLCGFPFKNDCNLEAEVTSCWVPPGCMTSGHLHRRWGEDPTADHSQVKLWRWISVVCLVFTKQSQLWLMSSLMMVYWGSVCGGEWDCAIHSHHTYPCRPRSDSYAEITHCKRERRTTCEKRGKKSSTLQYSSWQNLSTCNLRRWSQLQRF